MLNIELILYSVAADYKIYIQAPYMEVLNIYNNHIVYKNKTHTKIDQKVFQWAPIDVLALVDEVECPDFSFLLLLYLHG